MAQKRKPKLTDTDPDPAITEALAKRAEAFAIAAASRHVEHTVADEREEWFEVSPQFVAEFLRYMDTHVVSYERFPALVQHILLMRKAVQR
jgi:hypothetical protein